MKRLLAKIFAHQVVRRNKNWIDNPINAQNDVFQSLIKRGKKTQFGKDHQFHKIHNYEDFKHLIPITTYEDIRPYIDSILSGQKNVLWPGQPQYLSKTSGTTSGIKYIPITKASLPYHIKAARDAILNYIHQTKKTDFVTGKQIFLQGSPTLEYKNGLAIGRLSGIVAHHIPQYLQKNRMPSWETNTIEDWEEKVDKIVEETLSERMTIIAGIPPWVKMYFERIIDKVKKPIGQHFKDFSLFIHGGVNFQPYRQSMESLIGKKIDSIETYPASEGFIAYQDNQHRSDLLLLVNGGLFYEFVKLKEINNPNPNRIPLEDVELHIDYVLILSSNAGLWAYNIGDTVQFTSIQPYRIIVTGRVKHFISAFGEHVIGSEVEYALNSALNTYEHSVEVNEFTVAPQVNPPSGLPRHQWFIEFQKSPQNKKQFQYLIDQALQSKNIYYRDLVVGKVIRPLEIISIDIGGFSEYMKSIGKQGGQNKVPRLSNNRDLVQRLKPYIISDQLKGE
ncbi:MAG: GH3 auxin-responsive promoter family protein [Flavobacteriaceae bacterium]|nr:GH3 auxin-responsive promoter family protein [Flavobacteriaceae bacterium]MCY4216524.1 GH3 auxin-responsive promoter family protein [Flavobacteriaceae bacterium]MCY4254169.1 GH3 auxin-responsive promoter family protein [Flavobacteriaceae bacterium]